MAHSFEGDVPTLRYVLRAHANPGKRNDRFWFCWPALAFRVVAPIHKKRSMNILQRSVLGVLRAANLTAQEVAVRLGVHPELVAHVVVELQGRGRLSDTWEVTERGQRALLEEEATEAQLEASWVFQDPWSQDLWPFVASSLQQASVDVDANDRRVLQLGTTGSPWTQSLWSVKPPQTSGRVPSPEEILRASRRQQRFQERSQRMEHWDDDSEFSSVSGMELSRITTIQDTPEPVFLVSYLYGVQGQKSHDWYACDFFGFGSNPKLRRRFSEEARDFRPLQEQLSRWLGKTTSHANFEAYQGLMDQIRQEAEALLYRCMTAHIADHPERERLQRVFQALYEVYLVEGSVDASRCETVLIECRKTLEFFFCQLAKTHSLQGVSESMSRNDQELNDALICQAANDVGLDAPPASLRRARRGQVKSVSEHNDAWRLRPLIVATLLAARHDPSHPLRRVANQAPSVLETLDDLASSAGGASHANEHGWGFEILRDAVDDLARVICLFRELPHQTLSDVMNG